MSYFYSGTLKLSSENADPLLAAATQLEIPSAVDLCQKFLSQPKEELPENGAVELEAAVVDELHDAEHLSPLNDFVNASTLAFQVNSTVFAILSNLRKHIR